MDASLPRPDQAQARRQGKPPLDDCVTSLRTERNSDQDRGIAGPRVFVSAAQAGMRERHLCGVTVCDSVVTQFGLVPSLPVRVRSKRPAQLIPHCQKGGMEMFRRMLTVSVITVGLLSIGAPAFAAPPETETTVQKNLVETFVDIVPTSNCVEEGPLYTITTTTNLVEHSTVFADGREHDTFTQTGTFVAVPLEDPSLPSYTGKVTIWGGFNANGTTVNGTFTFNLSATGSDGSTINTHQVDHFNVRPDGTVNEFFHCH